MQGGDACTELSTIRADTCFAGVWHLPARMKSQNLESIAAETTKPSAFLVSSTPMPRDAPHLHVDPLRFGLWLLFRHADSRKWRSQCPRQAALGALKLRWRRCAPS